MNSRRWLRLRARFVAGGVALVATTVAASVWTSLELTALASATANVVQQIDETAAATAATASAIEREDDALLQLLGAPTPDPTVLRAARDVTDATLTRLRPGADDLQQTLRDYRNAADGLLARADAVPLDGYRQHVNPLLRTALLEVAGVRETRIDAARLAAAAARDGTAAAQRAAIGIAAIALSIAALVALRLARQILVPMQSLAVAAGKVRDGDFTCTVDAVPGDEIGEVAAAFNAMTRRIGEFRRSDLGQVLQAKATLEAVLHALPDAVLRFDGAGRVAAVNPQAEQLFAALGGPVPTDLAGVAAELADGDPVAIAALTAAPAANAPPLPIRIGCDPDVRHLLARAIPLPSDAAPGGHVLVLADVTDLARLDELRSELVAVASHELRTPVTTLRMSLLMLREAAAGLPERARALVDTALVGVESLRETVDELLDLTRIEAGRLRLQFERVELPGLLLEVVDRHRDRADELGIELVLAPGPCPPLQADRARLRLVFDNLLRNALHYTPRGGRISIAVTPDVDAAGTLEVSISDSGPGVPEPYRERVFEKFFRVEHVRPTADDAHGGAGIGLFLCRQIVERHGGSIRCTDATGGGARFVLEFGTAERG